MIATLHPVLWIVFWIFAPGFTLCALALIGYAVFGPPTGVELEEKRQQSFLDRMDVEAAGRRAMEKTFPPASGLRLVPQGGQEPIRKDGSPDAGENLCTTCQGRGTIDETLGGEHFSDPKAPCPDCK